MTEFVTINGQAVRVSRFYRRTVSPDPGESPVDEIELVIMLRGRTVQQGFQDLLRRPAFTVGIPDDDTMEMSLASASLQTSGTGEAAAHRYDVVFRETAESAEQRRRAQPALAEPAPAVSPPTADDEDELEAESARPESDIDWQEASVAWASALQQRSSAAGEPETIPDEPLTTAELAGVEAVLVGLRIEALIGALAQAGVVDRGAIDEAFVTLVAERFEIEAAPVVGEDAARRAAKGLADEVAPDTSSANRERPTP